MLDMNKVTIAGGAFLVLALVIVVIGALALPGGEENPAPPSGNGLQAAAGGPVDEEAVALFRENCGQCHTLSVAGTDGVVGPNLDDNAYTTERVLAAIARGGRGSGQMAPNLLVGADAEQVAELIGTDDPLR